MALPVFLCFRVSRALVSDRLAASLIHSLRRQHRVGDHGGYRLHVGIGLGQSAGRNDFALPTFAAPPGFWPGRTAHRLLWSFSLRIFHWAANVTAGSGALQTGFFAFTLVVLPTVLMGSTLPILVSYAVRLTRNVGTSVGALYAANTLGSAAACFCAGLFLMRWLGELRTVALAAGLNAMLGSAVLIWHFITRERHSAGTQILPVHIQDGLSTQNAEDTKDRSLLRPRGIGFAFAFITAGVAGFVSLGYEIVWYHLFSFTTGGVAKSFAFLLGAYLAGIGLGSMASNRICETITNPQAFIRFLVATILEPTCSGFWLVLLCSN